MSGSGNAICWVILAAIVAWGAPVSGQQPNRKPEPYIAPLLPAEAAWSVTLGAPPAAAAAMDDRHVYIPLQNVTTRAEGESAVRPETATITTLDRETGRVRWIRRFETSVPPLAAGRLLLVAGAAGIHALDASSGRPIWDVPIGARVRAAMLLREGLLVALTDADELIALRLDTQAMAWRRSIGEAGPTLFTADQHAIYLTTPSSRVVAVRLDDGAIAWERTLEGTLSVPAVGRDRVFVGSTARAFWALDPDSGDIEWVWQDRNFGGTIIGAAVEEDVVFVVALDNQIRALNRGGGNQRWREPIGTRPLYPPQVMFGTVVVTGSSPAALTTFAAKTGMPVSSWMSPPGAELQGPPLIDPFLKPYRVAAVVVMRDGRVTALKPTAMTFPAPAATPLTALPGRNLPLETLPGPR